MRTVATATLEKGQGKENRVIKNAPPHPNTTIISKVCLPTTKKNGGEPFFHAWHSIPRL